jgi:hypothetical protein
LTKDVCSITINEVIAQTKVDFKTSEVLNLIGFAKDGVMEYWSNGMMRERHGVWRVARMV